MVKFIPNLMLCECGCGQDAGTYSKTRGYRGEVKGQPRKYAHPGHSRRGKPTSPDHRRKMSLAITGKTHTPETRAKLSAIHKGRPLNELEKAARAKRRGVPLTEEHRQKVSAALAGKPRPYCAGELSKLWKGGTSPVRGTKQYARWAAAVKRRDNYTCTRCGFFSKRGLHAHHIWAFADFPEKRFDVDNGMTLCRHCHKGDIPKNPSHLRDLFINITPRQSGAV